MTPAFPLATRRPISKAPPPAIITSSISPIITSWSGRFWGPRGKGPPWELTDRWRGPGDQRSGGGAAVARRWRGDAGAERSSGRLTAGEAGDNPLHRGSQSREIWLRVFPFPIWNARTWQRKVKFGVRGSLSTRYSLTQTYAFDGPSVLAVSKVLIALTFSNFCNSRMEREKIAEIKPMDLRKIWRFHSVLFWRLSLSVSKLRGFEKKNWSGPYFWDCKCKGNTRGELNLWLFF